MTKVLIFDCDGVLADTERYGHLVAFNQMWRELGVPWQWSVEEYGRKLMIGGGKERMASLFQEPEFLAVFRPPDSEEERKRLVTLWHQRKTATYKDIISSGKIPARSGVRRLSEEALDKGWTLAVASTSAQDSVEAVLRPAVGEEASKRFSLVLAGDVVKAKKPAPDIYVLAAQKLGVSPQECVVVEDSRNGLLAAIRAGMKCVVTVSDYTKEEDFSEAVIVLTCLGDAGGEQCAVLANHGPASPGECFSVDDLEMVLSGQEAEGIRR